MSPQQSGAYWERTSWRDPEMFTGAPQKGRPEQLPPPLLGRATKHTAQEWDDNGVLPGDTKTEEYDFDAPYEEQAEARAKIRAERGVPPQKRIDRRGQEKVIVTGRMAELLNGEIGVEDLDDEELMTGSFRDKSGKLHSTNKLIPKAMHQEIMRRILQRGQEKIRQDFFGALDVVSEIMYDDQNDPSIRLRAANMIIERTAGKTPEKVELSVEVKKYEDVAVSILRELPEGIEEAEIVDDEDES